MASQFRSPDHIKQHRKKCFNSASNESIFIDHESRAARIRRKPFPQVNTKNTLSNRLAVVQWTAVRRLLQLGTIMLLTAILMPVQEVFDSWDEPGFSNDTEFAIFAFALTICLVMLVSYLIAVGLFRVSIVALGTIQHTVSGRHAAPAHISIFLVPPLASLPLRI